MGVRSGLVSCRQAGALFQLLNDRLHALVLDDDFFFSLQRASFGCRRQLIPAVIRA